MSAIFSLITNIFMVGCSIVGVVTIINKTGKFLQIIEDNKTNGFNKAFDCIILESIDEVNKSVTSINIITNNIAKLSFILYDISSGNKYIKKDKDGKIIICNNSKVSLEYKEKIEELTNKLKKYEDELKQKVDSHDLVDKSDESESSSDSDQSDDFYLENKN